MKQRKYNYLVILQGQYGQGWEDLTAAPDTRRGSKDMRAERKLYQVNEGGTYRIIRRRELVKP